MLWLSAGPTRIDTAGEHWATLLPTSVTGGLRWRP
jgi:hypothetical protein